MTKCLLALLIGLAVLVSACGGAGNSSPNPSGPTAAINLTGNWADTGGSTTWQLTHTGNSVTGSTFSVGANAVLGTYSGQGVLSGTVDGSTLTFTDTYATLTVPDCSEVVTGTFSINSANSVSGTVTIVDTCRSSVVFTRNVRDAFTRR
jgi:hypothetical protein